MDVAILSAQKVMANSLLGLGGEHHLLPEFWREENDEQSS